MKEAYKTGAINLNIVPFSLSDLDELMVIENQSFTLPWSRESYLELAPLDTIDIWVAKIDGELVGYMLLQHIAEEMELHTIAVKLGFRRKNIARKLLNHMISEAMRYNVKHLFLQVRPSNTAARNLYSEFGFMPVGRRKAYYQDNGEDALVLRLEMI